MDTLIGIRSNERFAELSRNRKEILMIFEGFNDVEDMEATLEEMLEPRVLLNEIQLWLDNDTKRQMYKDIMKDYDLE